MWFEVSDKVRIRQVPAERNAKLRIKSGKNPGNLFARCSPLLRQRSILPLRPDLNMEKAPRAAPVKAGRRPRPEAARSGLDGSEHGATLRRKRDKVFYAYRA